jgi:hypothetical protein
VKIAHHKFEVAFRGQPRPPCIGCHNRIKCGTEQLACWDFTQYLNLQGREKSDRQPNRARYLKCFPTTDEGDNV